MNNLVMPYCLNVQISDKRNIEQIIKDLTSTVCFNTAEYIEPPKYTTNLISLKANKRIGIYFQIKPEKVKEFEKSDELLNNAHQTMLKNSSINYSINLEKISKKSVNVLNTILNTGLNEFQYLVHRDWRKKTGKNLFTFELYQDKKAIKKFKIFFYGLCSSIILSLSYLAYDKFII